MAIKIFNNQSSTSLEKSNHAMFRVPEASCSSVSGLREMGTSLGIKVARAMHEK
jgi:hypothetical protein